MTDCVSKSLANDQAIPLLEEPDLFYYSAFDFLTSEDLLTLAEKNDAKNFFVFLNPVDPENGFPDISLDELKEEFESIYEDNDVSARFNRTRAIVVKSNKASVIRDLLTKKQFLGTKIVAKLATDNLTTRILLKQVPEGIPIFDLVTIIENFNKIKILAARRFFWEGNPSRTIILTIPGQISPQVIDCDGLKCQVVKYFENPKQCRKCFQFGHTQIKCNQAPICENCGFQLLNQSTDSNASLHDTSKCETLKCIHCSGNHKSSDKECGEYIKQKQILNLSKRQNFPFFEAKRIYYNQRRANSQEKLLLSKHPFSYTFESEKALSKFKEDIRIEIKKQDESLRAYICEEIKKLEEFIKDSLSQYAFYKELKKFKLNCNDTFDLIDGNFSKTDNRFSDVYKRINQVYEELKSSIEPELKRKRSPDESVNFSASENEQKMNED